MKYRLLICSVALSLFLGACRPEELSNLLPVITITPTSTQVSIRAPQASSRVLASPTAEPSETPSFTSTPTPTVTVTAPTPTDTLLPPLDIPTELPNAPSFAAWTGEPTYPGDSEPGRLFRVDYDPDVWAQTTDNFGQIVLGHRQIEYCTITAWTGRGLPEAATSEHEFRDVGNVPYDVNTVSMDGVLKFVAYVGGDKRLLTGFQVSFQDGREQCLQDAEKVLSSLRSFAAAPSITPTLTPEELVSSTPTP